MAAVYGFFVNFKLMLKIRIFYYSSGLLKNLHLLLCNIYTYICIHDFFFHFTRYQIVICTVWGTLRKLHLEEVQMKEVVSLATGTLCENSSNTFLSSSFLFVPCSVFWLVHAIQLILQSTILKTLAMPTCGIPPYPEKVLCLSEVLPMNLNNSPRNVSCKFQQLSRDTILWII